MGTLCCRTRDKTQRVRQRFRQGRSTEEDDDSKDVEGPNTFSELSRVAAYVGEKMIQQSYAPMDIGEVEGEAEGSDDQIDELRGTGKPRRDERSTHKRRRRHGQWYATTAEARDTERNCARHLQITPPKLFTRRHGRRRLMCADVNSMVQATKTMTSCEWDGSPQNKASGSVSQLWWTRAQLKTSYQQASAVM